MKNQILIQKIKTLKKIKPHSEWIILNRDFLLQEMRADRQLAPSSISFREYGQLAFRLFGQRLFEPAVVILIILGVFLGSSLIVNAAFYSLPGDSLYRMKIALEKAQVVMTPGEEKKVELKIEFAKKRVEEFDKIVQQTSVSPEVKKEKINLVMKEFKNNVVAVKEHIEKINKPNDGVAAQDKEKTLRMALTVSSKTNELAKELDQKSSSLSEVEKIEVKEIVAEAVASAQETSLSAQELISGVGEVTGKETVGEGVVEGEAVEVKEGTIIEEGVKAEESQANTTTVEAQMTTETGSEEATLEITPKIIK